MKLNAPSPWRPPGARTSAWPQRSDRRGLPPRPPLRPRGPPHAVNGRLGEGPQRDAGARGGGSRFWRHGAWGAQHGEARGDCHSRRGEPECRCKGPPLNWLPPSPHWAPHQIGKPEKRPLRVTGVIRGSEKPSIFVPGAWE